MSENNNLENNEMNSNNIQEQSFLESNNQVDELLNNVENNDIDTNVSKKKNSKKIIILVAIILVVIIVGVLAFFLLSKDDKVTNNDNKTNNNIPVSNDDSNGVDNSSKILTNLKENLEEKEVKDKNYYIYKNNSFFSSLGYEYSIYSQTEAKLYEMNNEVGTYTCNDNCTFVNNAFIHEDKSLEVFNEVNGKVEKAVLNKKYNTVDNNLIIEKYTFGKDTYYYGEYQNSKAFAKTEENDTVSLSFDKYNLLFGSSVKDLENGIYILATNDKNFNYYEIYNNKTKLNFNKENNNDADPFYVPFSISLEKNDSSYVVGKAVIGGEQYSVFTSQFEKIVEYYDWNSDCVYNNNAYYCFKNSLYEYDDGGIKATVSKYDDSGKETLIRNYINVIDISSDLKVMALTSENKFEVFDLLNNKVLYTFDALTSTQSQVYSSYFRTNNYFDSKNNKFYAFVEDTKLSIKDFPDAKEDYENHFGYYFTYNVMTNEANVEKKAIFISEE